MALKSKCHDRKNCPRAVAAGEMVRPESVRDASSLNEPTTAGNTPSSLLFTATEACKMAILSRHMYVLDTAEVAVML